MTCELRHELLPLYALGTLDAGEMNELRAHLAFGCPSCAGVLAESEALLAQIPLTLEPVTPSPGVRDRLMARIEVGSERPEPARAPRRAAAWLAWFNPALAAGLTAAAMHFFVSAPLVREQQSLQEVVARQTTQIEQLRSVVSDAMIAERFILAPELDVVALAGLEAGSEARGRILWDREHDAWHVSVTGFEQLASNKTYELWFITDQDEKIPAGMFDVGADGRGRLYVEIPEGLGNLVVAAITDEPKGGSPQPTGAIHVLGKLPVSST